jgi:hypothetical protein
MKMLWEESIENGQFAKIQEVPQPNPPGGSAKISPFPFTIHLFTYSPFTRSLIHPFTTFHLPHIIQRFHHSPFTIHLFTYSPFTHSPIHPFASGSAFAYNP